MTTRVNLQPVFILHSRPFRDSSMLLDLLTRQHGRIAAIAKGVRSSKSKQRGLLLPFVPLFASWSGRTELMTLGKVEPNGRAYFLTGNALLNGFYLNELLVRLLHRDDPHPQLFKLYQDALGHLQAGEHVELVLRLFEKQLLRELGYGLQLNYDANHCEVDTEASYCYLPERGLVKVTAAETDQVVYFGKHLLALHHGTLVSSEDFRQAKLLLRNAIKPLLGNKPIKSRELYC